MADRFIIPKMTLVGREYINVIEKDPESDKRIEMKTRILINNAGTIGAMSDFYVYDKFGKPVLVTAFLNLAVSLLNDLP